jgi:hypothetical protein
MALDPTAREANVRDSVKKYFVDNLYRGESIELTFDTALDTPKIQNPNSPIDKWVSINFGSFDFDNMSEYDLRIFCCARNDPEGFKLAQLRDKVMGYLTDNTKNDGMARIPFYKSYADRAWELLGGLLLFVETESGQMTAPDGTKYKMIPVTMRWGAKP